MTVKISESVVRNFFFKLLKNHKKELIIIVSVATFGSVLTAFVPYIYGQLFDLAVIPNTNLSLLLSLIGIWALLGLVSNYATARTFALGEILGNKISFKVETDAYTHFLKLPVSFHKNKKIGSILQKVSNGSSRLKIFIALVSDFLPSVLFMIFAMVAMLIIKWQLGVITVFTFLVYSLITLKLTKPALKSLNNMHRISEKEYGKVYDRLYNVFLIKNFAMEESQKKQIFRSLILRTLPSVKKNTGKFARLQYFQGIVYNLGFVLTLTVAIFFLRDGQISGGEFIMFFSYINLSFGPFFRLSNFYRSYKEVSVAIKRIIRLKNLVPEEMKHGSKVISNFKGRISFQNVSFSYTKKRETLKDINLKIKAGESVALVGESGMGKSTLSELILGYYKPSKGKILLDDVNISRLKLSWLRNQVAIVPQEISILNDTLLNNIRHANPNASLDDVIKAAKAANAHDFIMSLPKNYRTLVGERGVRLSVGQKQRIGITMAFLKNPKILILDESTASLDAKSERSVQEGIKQLIRGRTTIIIAHRFSTVKNVDKIFVLDKANIIEAGNHKELMEQRGKYYELYKLQTGLD